MADIDLGAILDKYSPLTALPEVSPNLTTFYYPETPEATRKAGLSPAMEGGVTGAGRFSDIDLRNHTLEKFRSKESPFVAVAMPGAPTGDTFRMKVNGEPIIAKNIDTGGGLRNGQIDVATSNPELARTGVERNPELTSEEVKSLTPEATPEALPQPSPNIQQAISEVPEQAMLAGNVTQAGLQSADVDLGAVLAKYASPTPAPTPTPAAIPEIDLGAVLSKYTSPSEFGPAPDISTGEPTELQKIGTAISHYGKSMIPPTPPTLGEAVKQGALQAAYQSIPGGLTIPETQHVIGRINQIRESEKTPGFSQERHDAAIGTVLDLTQAALGVKGAASAFRGRIIDAQAQAESTARRVGASPEDVSVQPTTEPSVQQITSPQGTISKVELPTIPRPKLVAAFKTKDGEIIQGKIGEQHTSLAERTGKFGEEGFSDAEGNYYNREQAHDLTTRLEGPMPRGRVMDLKNYMDVRDPNYRFYGQDPEPLTVSRFANRFMPEQPGGVGIPTQDLVQRGMRMTPDQISQHVSDVMQDVPGDIVEQASALRAEEARLSERSTRLSQQSMRNPSDVEAKIAAQNALNDWQDFKFGPVAKIKTQWSNAGRAMQGEIPVDLSTLNGQIQAWINDVGSTPPPEALPQLSKLAKEIMTAADNRVKLAENWKSQASSWKTDVTDEMAEAQIKELLKKLTPC